MGRPSRGKDRHKSLTAPLARGLPVQSSAGRSGRDRGAHPRWSSEGLPRSEPPRGGARCRFQPLQPAVLKDEARLRQPFHEEPHGDLEGLGGKDRRRRAPRRRRRPGSRPRRRPRAVLRSSASSACRARRASSARRPAVSPSAASAGISLAPSDAGETLVAVGRVGDEAPPFRAAEVDEGGLGIDRGRGARDGCPPDRAPQRMPPRPVRPDPLEILMSTVSAWSSSVWAVTRWEAPVSRARPTSSP